MLPNQPTQDTPSRKPVSQLRYELLTLGDELLLGLTANSHLSFIGEQLGKRGAMLRRNVTVTDDADDIVAQFRESWERSDVVITTGGLGPTCDDRTREAIAEVLGLKLVFDPSIEEAIRERFKHFGRTMTPNNLKQAYRFDGGLVLPNPNGTAPGLWVERDGKVLAMLPGPPNEMHPMFVSQVMPRLASLGLLQAKEAYVQVRTAGVGESALEHKLQAIFCQYPEGLSVAYCAHLGQVDVRVSSPDRRLDEGTLQQIAAECALLLGEDFVCFGHDSIAKLCAGMLRRSGSTLAVAEGAKGGMLADAFSHLCGASKYFSGGVVCPTNDAKAQLLDIPEEIMLQHGAASAEVAVAMAMGLAEKVGADYALATTGFVGPCEGEHEGHVGSIFIALQSPSGVWSREIKYPGPRHTIRQRAVNAALDWLRRELMRTAGTVCGE